MGDAVVLGAALEQWESYPVQRMGIGGDVFSFN